jgi:hypothetical protein
VVLIGLYCWLNKYYSDVPSLRPLDMNRLHIVLFIIIFLR